MTLSSRLSHACVIALIFCFCIPSVAFARDDLPDPDTIKAAPVDEENPVRLVLIDVTDKTADAKSILGGLSDELSENPQVELVEIRPVILSFVDRKITKEILRTGDGREQSGEDIAAVIAEHNLDGLLILDAYSGGRKLQVILFAPDGSEADEQKRSLKKRKRISGSEREKVAGRIVEKTIPLAMKKREALAKQEREAIEAKLAARAKADEFGDDGGGGGDTAVAKTTKSEKKRARGQGKGGVYVRAGLLLGQRNFVLESDSFGIDQALPMAGATAQLEVATPVADGVLLIGGTFRGSWAPLRLLDASAETETILSGQFVDAGGNLDIDFPYASLLEIGLDLGMDVTSITIEPNPTYTGHRYIWGRAGVGFEITPISKLAIRLHGAALPVFQSLTSGGAYGAPGLDVGIEAGGGLEFIITDAIGLGVDARYLTFTQLYNSDNFDETLVSSDQIIRGAVSVTYRR